MAPMEKQFSTDAGTQDGSDQPKYFPCRDPKVELDPALGFRGMRVQYLR